MTDVRGRQRDLETARRGRDYRSRAPERLDGSLTRLELAEILEGLHFDRGHDYVRTVEIDSDARDYLVRALRR